MKQAIRWSILNAGVEVAVLFLRLPMRLLMAIFFSSLALGMNRDVVAVRVHAEPDDECYYQYPRSGKREKKPQRAVSHLSTVGVAAGVRRREVPRRGGLDVHLLARPVDAKHGCFVAMASCHSGGLSLCGR